MPYISELLNNKIYDSSDSSAGRLEDILISQKNGSFSPLEYLVVRLRPHGEVRYVPYEAVENFTSRQISLKNLFNNIAISELPGKQYIHLRRDVLDQQIVDVEGTRVVRVNDLRIGNFDNRTCVLAIDSSFHGLLRRLGLAGSFLAWPFSVHLIDWRQAQLLGNRGTLQINTVAERLGHLHPADLANILEEMDIKRGSTLLASLDDRKAAKVLEEVDPEWQNILVKYLAPDQVAKILPFMSTDEIADLSKNFTNEEARKFLSQIQDARAANIKKLSEYPNNTAGGLMTVDYVTVRPEWTVVQAQEEVRRRSPDMRSVIFVYVTGADNTFYGVVSLRRLITAPEDTLMKDMTKNLASVSTLKPEDKMDTVIELMTRYNLYTAAVLDDGHKLVGIVTIDDVMRELFPTA